MTVIFHVSAVYIANKATVSCYPETVQWDFFSIYIAPPETIDGYSKIINIAFTTFPWSFVFQSYSVFRVPVLRQGTAFIVKTEIIVVINTSSH